MFINDYGKDPCWASPVQGGWITPTEHQGSAKSFRGSVYSLHPAGSVRSLGSLHSHQPCRCYIPEQSRRRYNCGPVYASTPTSYVQHHVPQYNIPNHCSGMYSNGSFNSHRGIALHRGVDLVEMKSHLYPEGGWGWIVCAAGFLALLLTTGMQLAFGILHLCALRHLGEHHMMDIAWVGALSAAVSQGSAPLVVSACRRGSTRLTAVIGGLVFTLASLFTSFASQVHQVILSYGVVLGAGAGLVRETAGLMLGHYFRKQREFVEMVMQAGAGVGIALFSVFYKEAVGKLGWKLGLQTVTGSLCLTFFLGLIYRSAALYHPYKTPILQPKNQRTKVKEKNSKCKSSESLLDLSPLRSQPVRMLMLAAGSAGFGLYTPAFYIALQGYQDGLEASALILLQTCLGLAAALGCVAWGIVTARPSAQCLVSRQYLCQTALIGVAVAQVAFSNVQGYDGLVLASGLYGVSLGGALYSLKMLALERLRARHFARSWALVQAAEAVPILLGVPLTGYMNASHPRVGYYACTLSSLCGAALLSLVGWGRYPTSPLIKNPLLASTATIQPVCICQMPRPRLHKSRSIHVPLDLNQLPNEGTERCSSHRYCYTPHFHHHTTLRPSKSVPEGLGHSHEHYHSRPQRRCDVTVVEQMTTSV